jgi:hypothetical protein
LDFQTALNAHEIVWISNSKNVVQAARRLKAGLALHDPAQAFMTTRGLVLVLKTRLTAPIKPGELEKSFFATIVNHVRLAAL